MQVIVRVQVVTGVQVNRLIGGCWLFQGVHFIAGGNSHFIKVIRVQVGARGSSHRRSAGKGKGADGCTRGVDIRQRREKTLSSFKNRLKFIFMVIFCDCFL